MENSILKGLYGVEVDTTTISHSNPLSHRLSYRGYELSELARSSSFEDVAYLLLHADLAQSTELNAFASEEKEGRFSCSEALDRTLALIHSMKTAEPTDVLRTAISFYGALVITPLSGANNETDHNRLRRSIDLLAKIPVFVAADFCTKTDRAFTAPRKDLSNTQNFFWMCFGALPSADRLRAFEMSRILYAEHGFNAATFTARVVTSTLVDFYSSVVAALSALKGPIHGGAIMHVMAMLEEIGSPEQTDAWLDEKFHTKTKIMGFGHRIYKNGDPRNQLMKKCLDELSDPGALAPWLRIMHRLEERMQNEKDIRPNLDLPAALLYHHLGFDKSFHTNLIVMSRCLGWFAHIREQLENNRIIRPLSRYIGPDSRGFTPMARRDDAKEMSPW